MKVSCIFVLWAVFFGQGANAARGTNVETRIIGGQNAFAGQFPFAAAIHVQTSDSRHFCGGTLSANQWIITSGTCVYNAVSFTIQLGSKELESDDPYRVTVATSNYVLHPYFDPYTLQNDIGLIQLRFNVEFDIYMQPIHPLVQEVAEDAHLYVLGWGQTSDSTEGPVNELQYVTLTPITNTECRITYGDQITDNMICVAGNFNEGLCIGDNGGALAVQSGRSYALVGVASFVSSDGCESTHPSGFTRTFPYYDWIVNITHELDETF